MNSIKFSEQLKSILLQYNLLEHDFYKHIWNKGKMPKNVLEEYACQYYAHVKNFAPSIAGIIANCDEQKTRQVLIENLNDEDTDKANGEINHITLWRNFALGLELSEERIDKTELFDETKNLLSTYRALSKDSFESGLGMIFAQEHNYSNIAESKGESLECLYDVKSKDALRFFNVHKEADLKHTEDLCNILDNSNFSDDQKNTIIEAGIKAMNALNGFLNGMMKHFNLYDLCECESMVAA